MNGRGRRRNRGYKEGRGTATGELGEEGPGDEGIGDSQGGGGGLHLELGSKASGPAVAVERAVERLAKRALFLAAGTPAQRVLAMVTNRSVSAVI